MFTDMEEMKRWQAEREDQLHREQVRKQLADYDRWVAEYEKQQRDIAPQSAASLAESEDSQRENRPEIIRKV